MNNEESLSVKIEGVGLFVKIDSTTYFCEFPEDEKLSAIAIDVIEDKEVEEKQLTLLKEVVANFDDLLAKSVKYYEASEEYYNAEMGPLRYVDISIYSAQEDAEFCIQNEFISDEDYFIAVDFINMTAVDIYGDDE